jgi:hypothetical protein
VPPNVRPGGGPLTPGDTVLLSDLFDPLDLAPGTEFGLFLVADGFNRNGPDVFGSGSLEFRSNGGPATIADPTPALVHIATDGTETLVLGDIMHTADVSPDDPLVNVLNPDGGGQVTSGVAEGQFTVAFEDLRLDDGDRDFNDALFAVDLLEPTIDGSAGAQVAGGPSSELQALLTSDEPAIA